MSDDSISKIEFAAAVGVTPSRVSQYIGTGKIHGDALVGSGRSARIRKQVALEQLKIKLDGGHRARASAKARLEPAATSSEPSRIPANDIEHQIQQERLEGFRRDNRRKAEEEAARRGRYTLTDDVTKSMGRLAAMMIGMFESWLGELASKLAAAFGLPQRDVLHVLRREFRLFRAGASAAMRREAVQLPDLVEDVSENTVSSGVALANVDAHLADDDEKETDHGLV